MARQQSRYLSYLLRLWQTGSQPIWRASLESPLTGERQGFASLQELFTFLETQAEAIERQGKKERPQNQDED